MKTCRSQCPISYALEIFGDKWTLLIIRDMILLKKKTYSEFKSSPEGIATNILANRLSLLEEHGIVSKAKDPNNNKVNLYTLTPKGIDFIPILLEMSVWGAKYDKNTGAPQGIIQKIIDDRSGVIAQIKACLNDPDRTIFD